MISSNSRTTEVTLQDGVDRHEGSDLYSFWCSQNNYTHALILHTKINLFDELE